MTSSRAPAGSASSLAELFEQADVRAMPTFPVSAPLSDIGTHLESVELAELSENDLVEVVAGWQQIVGMAVAHQARAIAELEARATAMHGFMADELACAMVTTRAAVDVLAGRAAGLNAYPVLADALLAGTVDARKVDLILAETATLAAGSERALAIDAALEAARGLTGPQLVRHVRRHVLGLDPKTAKKRAAAARADRCVELQWANDSLARLIAFVPAATAVAAYTVLDALAATTGDALDGRTLDQRRADAFGDIFGTIIDSERTPSGDPVPRKHGRRVAVNLTVAATTLLGLDENPGELAGYGPIPAPVARELAQEGTWRRILTDPAGAFLEAGSRTYRPGADLTRTVQTRDVTCTWPGCRQPATRSELDHIEPYDHRRAPGAPMTPVSPAPPRWPAAPDAPDASKPQTRADNLHALCKRHHQAKTAKVWNVRRDKATGNTIWTSPLGITYSRSPIPVLVAPGAWEHRRPRSDLAEPPPF